MERIACIAHARPLVCRAPMVLLCGLLLSGTGAAADIPGLDKTETKNVELVVKNLDDLVKTAGDFIQKEKGAAVWVPSGSLKKKVAAFADVDDYKAVLANLKTKLAGKNLHSIPGLSEKTPPKYSLGDPNEKGVKPGHPRAAYCVPHTFVKIGNAWLPCPERDIIVDKPILDPPGAHGQPIDETTDQGWKDKWTLVHVLVHEKWHERDDAEKKMKDLDEAARDAKQKMIDAMSQEARKAYYERAMIGSMNDGPTSALAHAAQTAYISPGADPRPTSMAFPQRRPSPRQRGAHSRIGMTTLRPRGRSRWGVSPVDGTKEMSCRSRKISSG